MYNYFLHFWIGVICEYLLHFIALQCGRVVYINSTMENWLYTKLHHFTNTV